MDVIFILLMLAIAVIALFLVYRFLFGGPRQADGGLVVVFGFMRSGKTWYATRRMLRFIDREKSTARAFANYRIVHPKYGPVNMWKNDLMNHALVGCLIVIDEAYMYDEFNCRVRDLSKKQQKFFATCGQNDTKVIFILQDYSRLENTLRDLAEEYIQMIKTAMGNRVLWFTALHYYGQRNTSRRKANKKERFINWPWKREFGRVYAAYNTYNFRRRPKKNAEYVFERWPVEPVPEGARRVPFVRARRLLRLAFERGRPLVVQAAGRCHDSVRSLYHLWRPLPDDGPGLWDCDLPALDVDWIIEFVEIEHDFTGEFIYESPYPGDAATV